VGALNDLWEFSLSTRLWAWMGGRETAPYGVPTDGIYGHFRVPGPANVPGGRTPAARWTDRQGNLWLFGGGGYDAVGNNDLLNDLWKYQVPYRWSAPMLQAILNFCSCGAMTGAFIRR
jgi:hypothetical protein